TTAIEELDLHACRDGDDWRFRGVYPHGKLNARCRFVIDASGPTSPLVPLLGLDDETDRLRTQSHALFAHFHDVLPWEDVLDELEIPRTEYPFCADRAALHHLLDEGWMWQLRFADGLLSAGFVLDGIPANRGDQSADAIWRTLLDRYPSIARQFANARLAASTPRLTQIGRLQRCLSAAAGDNWALLPFTCGFVDPLHSTGIAHTLSAIERLMPALLGEVDRCGTLAEYGRDIPEEIRWVDQLVALCQQTRRVPRLFNLATMVYFAAATTYEQERLTGESFPRFLACGDATRSIAREIESIASRSLQQLSNGSESRSPDDGDGDNILNLAEQEIAATLAPINHVGLCDPLARNMYRQTEADKMS
ncbi:MAG: tryptophan 7-halogenase, partial [Planctomycetaceae bacterium]|nr:tryptophan 7-halogenase [Planctomycetaceae bacterium]